MALAIAILAVLDFIQKRAKRWSVDGVEVGETKPGDAKGDGCLAIIVDVPKQPCPLLCIILRLNIIKTSELYGNTTEKF